jgi:hypothetical protein
MHGFKKFLRGLILALFAWLLVGLAVTSALVMSFNSPGKIKESLNKSGVYNTFIDGALKEVKKSSEKNSNSEDVPIDDPSVQSALKKAFTPQLLQSTTENLLDGSYEWLSGESKEPTFNINLTEAKSTFAEAVGASALQKISTLPACTPAQLQQLSGGEIDLFNLPCQPPAQIVAQQQSQLVSEIKNSKEFLENPVLNAKTLPKDDQGKTVFDNLEPARSAYKWANASPWLLAVLALISAAAVVFLHDFKRRGLRSVSLTLGITAILILVFNWVGRWSLSNASKPNGALSRSAEGSFQQTVIKGIDSISASVSQIIVWFALGYLLIATIVLAILYFIKPKQPANEHKKDPTEDKSNKPAEQQTKPDRS